MEKSIIMESSFKKIDIIINKKIKMCSAGDAYVGSLYKYNSKTIVRIDSYGLIFPNNGDKSIFLVVLDDNDKALYNSTLSIKFIPYCVAIKDDDLLEIVNENMKFEWSFNND